jgi:hypothetical protein
MVVKIDALDKDVIAGAGSRFRCGYTSMLWL